MTFFSYRLITAPTLSAFQRSLSIQLQKLLILFGCHPWMVSPGQRVVCPHIMLLYFMEKKVTVVLHSQVITDDDKFSRTRRDDLLLSKTTAAALDEVDVFIHLVSTVKPNINLHNDTKNCSFICM